MPGPSLVLLAFMLLLVGCSGRVTPPTSLGEPVDFYLVDHGRHSSLVLPREDGVVRYTYGEWRWYAEGRRGMLAGMSAMLWPTRGTLGRQVFPDTDLIPFPEQVAPEGVEEVFPLQAEATRVTHLQRHLDAIFDQQRDSLTYHSGYDLEFVSYPRGYWLAHQSNLVVAQWLRMLDFEVGGLSWLSKWRIEEATEASPVAE